MSVSSLSDLSHQQMLNILGYSSSSNQTGQTNGTSNGSGNLSMPGSNSGQLSPFAQMLVELQQMEESNPGQYAKVSQQISTNLSTAASTAQSRGNTSLATQLNTLSQDFSSASQTGQLPNVGDLEKAMQAARSGGSASSASLPTGGAHSHAINIIGSVLGLAN